MAESATALWNTVIYRHSASIVHGMLHGLKPANYNKFETFNFPAENIYHRICLLLKLHKTEVTEIWSNSVYVLTRNLISCDPDGPTTPLCKRSRVLNIRTEIPPCTPWLFKLYCSSCRTYLLKLYGTVVGRLVFNLSVRLAAHPFHL